MRRVVCLSLALALVSLLASAGAGLSQEVPPAPEAAAAAPVWNPAALEAELRTRLERDPADAGAHRLLGELFAGESRLTQSIAHYRESLRLDPKHWAARLGLARSLAWAGHTEESARLFDALLAEDPLDAEALFGRGQLARWGGERSRARALLQRAISVEKNDPRFHAELAWLELSGGRLGSAWEAAGKARDLGGEPADLRLAIDAALALSARVKTAFSDESQDFRRSMTTARFEFSPLPDTRMRLRSTYTHFSDSTGDMERYSLGARVRQVFSRDLYAIASYDLHSSSGIAATHEFLGEFGGQPFAVPIAGHVGGRRRSIVDVSPGYEDIAYLEGVGSGGSTLNAIRGRRQISEVYAGVSTTLVPAGYAYGSFAAGWINDGNHRVNAAAGVGVDLLRLLRGPKTQRVTLKYDFFYLSVDRSVQNYWSPSSFQTHTPGLDWRWEPTDSLLLGLEAGIPLQPGESPGWVGGGFIRLALTQAIHLEARARHTEDTAFRITSGTLSLYLSF